MRKALPLLGVLLALVGYLALYGFARRGQRLVHVRATTQDSHGHFVVADHSVRPAPDASPLVMAFTPLRWVETGLWFVLEPRGSSLGLP